MKIVLEIGDSLEVLIKGAATSEDDPAFTIIYGDQALSVEAHMPDTDGKKGLIYSERYEEPMSDHDLLMESNQGGPAPGFSGQMDYGYGRPDKPMSNEKRLELEMSLVRLVIEDAIASGYRISCNDGGPDNWIEDSVDVEAIMKEMRSADDERILFQKTTGPNQFLMGSIYLVYGNAPWEVVNDCTPRGDEICKMRYEAAADAMQREWS